MGCTDGGPTPESYDEKIAKLKESLKCTDEELYLVMLLCRYEYQYESVLRSLRKVIDSRINHSHFMSFT